MKTANLISSIQNVFLYFIKRRYIQCISVCEKFINAHAEELWFNSFVDHIIFCYITNQILLIFQKMPGQKKQEKS